MKKIILPIDKEDIDNIRPGKPDIGWFFKMLIILLPFIVIGYLLFYIFAYFIVGNISLEKEREYFGNFMIDKESMKLFDINKLENKIYNFDEYNIYLKSSDDINAYAVLGGNIIITTGLLKELEYEEELIFILGHEAEHIKNRDVLESMLSDIPFIITIQFLGFDILTGLINFSEIPINYASKNTELISDKGGINIINSMNLNLECSLNFFKKDADTFNTYLQLISTHPTNIKRIIEIEKEAKNTNTKCTKLNLFLK